MESLDNESILTNKIEQSVCTSVDTRSSLPRGTPEKLYKRQNLGIIQS